MKLLIFGPPGSGKGTYSQRLEKILGTKHISTGDIFREEVKKESELGKKVKEFLEKGELVPDEIVNEVVKERLKNLDKFILDGYPRTLAQAKFLEENFKIDAIIKLEVPDWILIKRLTSRRVCKKCGKIYNLLYLKPKVEGICDECKGELYQRSDDKEETVRKRLEVYVKQTQPILEYFKGKIPLIEIKCEKLDLPPEFVVNQIVEKLKHVGAVKS